MLAERWNHAVGELPSILPRAPKSLCCLSGGTLVATRAGLPQRTLGGAQRLALSLPEIVRISSISGTPVDDCLHISFRLTVRDVVLQDSDIDPARVALRYEAVGLTLHRADRPGDQPGTDCETSQAAC